MFKNNQNAFVIIDLESTCDPDGQIPRHEIEIIEIGAVVGVISPTGFKASGVFQEYVRPQINPKLTPLCTELTGIEQSTVDSSSTLQEALVALKAWLDCYNILGWGSWGKFDFTQISMETDAKDLTNPFTQIKHLNLKQLFARCHKHRVGLARAVSMTGLEFEGSHHSGLDDSRNIARILEADPLLREAIIKRLV